MVIISCLLFVYLQYGMPLFKKSPSDAAGSLSERYIKVLQRCRMLLMKDANVYELLDALSNEDGFRSDVRDAILAQPTSQQQVALLLDKLENRGDKAFGIFMDCLKEHHRHLHSVLEETLRNLHDIDENGHRDKTSMAGEMVRKLVRSGARRSRYEQGSESGEEMDYAEEEDDEFYLDCYSIPLKGKRSREPWIKHGAVEALKADDAPDEGRTYMATMMKDTVFRKVEMGEIPCNVKTPPKYCQVYVIDSDQSIALLPTNSVPNHKSDSKPQLPARGKSNKSAAKNHSTQRNHIIPEIKIPDEPPPVPPKPENLPPLSPRPPVLRMKKVSRKSQKEKPKLMPKPKLPLRNGQINSEIDIDEGDYKEEEEDESEDSETEKESEEEEEEEDELDQPMSPSPALPPRRPKQLSLNSHVTECDDQWPAGRPLSLVAEESQSTEAVNLNGLSCGKSSGVKRETQKTGLKIDTHNVNKPEMVVNGDISNADGESEEEYEVITPKCEEVPDRIEQQNTATKSVEAEDLNSLELQIPIGSMADDLDVPIDDDDEEDDEIDGSELGEGSVESHKGASTSSYAQSKNSSDSLTNSNENSVDKKGVEDRNSIEIPIPSFGTNTREVINDEVQLPTKKGGRKEKPKPPQLLPRRSVSEEPPLLLANGQSSEDDSYYEDIDVMETSSPSGSSYLEPKAYAKILESAVCSAMGQHPGHRAFDYYLLEGPDRLLLKQGELLIADSDAACQNAPAASTANSTEDLIESVTSVYRGTFLIYDKLARAFYIPGYLLKKHGDPEGEPWFFPIDISSRQAALFLSEVKQEGCFLVYRPINKTSGAVYNLSVCRANGDVVHYHIMRNIHGDVMVANHDQSFMNVSDLVTYFQRNKSRLATRLRRPLREAHLPVTAGHHYPQQWEIQRAGLGLTGQIIGKGQFGVVCAGIYKKVPVAVKVLQKSDVGVAEEDDFISEARMLMGLKHEHVVRLIGVSCSAKPFFLVTEYVTRGNLRDNLRSGSLAPNMDTLFDVCIQVTSALFYLESQRFLLHRDLAARNCLVSDDMCIKVADFGRAIFVADDSLQASKSEKIAVKWAPPEVLTHSLYSTKSDVWSMGVLYWEVFSAGARPYPTLTAEQTAIYVTEGGRLEKPAGCSPDIYALMKCCWRPRPEERPTFAILYDRMKGKSNLYYGPIRPRSGNSDTGSVKASVSTPAQTKKSPTRKGPSVGSRPTDELARDLLENLSRDIHSNGNARSGSRERLPASSSETSLISAFGQGKDDLSRGDKIRLSLRKIMKSKNKRKPSNISQGSFRSPDPLVRDTRTLPASGQYFV